MIRSRVRSPLVGPTMAAWGEEPDVIIVTPPPTFVVTVVTAEASASSPPKFVLISNL
jgi:hypothetical protein